MCVIRQGKLCVIVAGAALVVAAAPALAAERTYYIAAEDVVWNYAPTRQNLVHGGKIPAPWTRNTCWKKTRYVEYTDGTFSVRTPQPEWLGVLGPIIRAEVGDTVVVHFVNRTKGHYGKTLRFNQRNTDVIELLPGSMATADMLADNPGTWLFHCHVGDHLDAGMLTTYRIEP